MPSSLVEPLPLFSFIDWLNFFSSSCVLTREFELLNLCNMRDSIM